MDLDPVAFARSFQAFADRMSQLSHQSDEADGGATLTQLGAEIAEFLDTDPGLLEPMTETFPNHQVVDLDIALNSVLSTYGGERFGIRGRHLDQAETYLDFLHRGFADYRRGPMSYVRKPTGPDTDRRIVTLGIALLHIDGVPVTWLQRAASSRRGRDHYTLELLSPATSAVEQLMQLVRAEMSRLSVLRGQVISFTVDDFDYHNPSSGLTFHHRPDLKAEHVVLPAGVLERITRHVVGVGDHRDQLTAAGQHLKRGILLYGPPGTGKTHLVRHLLSQTPGTTAVLLSGRTLHQLREATMLARAAQPALIVLEDCDLVAEHRGGDSNAALFETLEAMDGLAPDADITFILTTNRPDLLETALVERPGRVDLAIEVDKPDLAGRRKLFRLYGATLLAPGGITDAALDDAAEATAGVTASFVKEAVRRTILTAAPHHRIPTDDDLTSALDEMLSDSETLTRTLLGGAAATSASPTVETLGPATTQLP